MLRRMANDQDKLTARIQEAIDAATLARSHLATISDQHVKQAAERIIDELLRDTLHDCFAPRFRAKKKKKK
jgi:hypothetical protein